MTSKTVAPARAGRDDRLLRPQAHRLESNRNHPIYSVSKSQHYRAMVDRTGNLPPLPGIFPDMSAPIVRTGADGSRELVMARWGLPSPAFALAGKRVDRGVTNVRNTDVHIGADRSDPPRVASSRSPASPSPGDGRTAALRTSGSPWRTTGRSRSSLALTRWTCIRKLAAGEITCDLFGFLTTTPCAEVAAVHQKAMPVILTDTAEMDAWLTAPWAVSRVLQRPLRGGALTIVAVGEKQDGGLDLVD